MNRFHSGAVIAFAVLLAGSISLGKTRLVPLRLLTMRSFTTWKNWKNRSRNSALRLQH